MPLIETKGAASAQGFGLTIGGAQPVYIEDVFSTYLYTGNGSTQTITNGIDLSGKGGLTWFGSRNAYVGIQHYIIDSARGIGKTLYSYSTDAQGSFFNGVNSYNSNGVTLNSGDVNASGNNGVLWTFRKQPKFFDIVTYTGNGSAGRTISHNLGSYPGCIIVKKTSAADNWLVWHRSLSSPTTSSSGLMWLNTTNAEFTGVGSIYVPSGNTTTFTVASGSDVNQSGATYVAYLFAHNAGGFGLTGTDNVVSCGSFTGPNADVNLGWEPQWVLMKAYNLGGAGDGWFLIDNMRGWSVGGNDNYLQANSTAVEGAANFGYPTATGFNSGGQSGNFIYIAIRRGPMKVPTSGTSVFSPIASGGGTTTVLTTGFPVDMQYADYLAGSAGNLAVKNTITDRLRGLSSTSTDSGAVALHTSSTNAEDLYSSGDSFTNTTFTPSDGFAGSANIYLNFRRAPGFFDVVCYTGNASIDRLIPHNLGVTPTFIIVKNRDTASTYWSVYHVGAANPLVLNTTAAANFSPNANNGYVGFGGTNSTVFQVSGGGGSPQFRAVNESPLTYVAYLFATCPGVSKVGSYTGNGSSQTINCGFTGGARFIMIKRTNSTGDWYVWDTARGIVAGNDPHLSLNSTAAEVTTNDSIDTDSTGFIVNQLAATNINVSSATYIFLAIA